jgi:hypothetical protein
MFIFLIANIKKKNSYTKKGDQNTSNYSDHKIVMWKVFYWTWKENYKNIKTITR